MKYITVQRYKNYFIYGNNRQKIQKNARRFVYFKKIYYLCKQNILHLPYCALVIRGATVFPPPKIKVGLCHSHPLIINQ